MNNTLSPNVEVLNDNFTNTIYKLLSIFFAAYMGILIIGVICEIISRSTELFARFNSSKMVLIIFLILIVLIGVLTVIYFMYLKIQKIRCRYIVLILFTLAFLLRASFCIAMPHCEPISDFANYFHFGSLFYDLDFNEVADICDYYQVPSFAGLAVLNGIIGLIFSDTLLGFQMANAVITSISCVMIFVIGRKYKKNVGIIASFLFCIYPSNIVGTAITNNQHGMVLFSLFALFFLSKAFELRNKYCYIYAFTSGICYVIANYFHPSLIITMVAILCSSLLIVISYIRNKPNAGRAELKKLLIIVLIILLLFFSLPKVLNRAMMELGLLNTTNSISMVVKFVVGFNQETLGKPSRADLDIIESVEFDEQTKVGIEVLRERINNLDSPLNFFFKKGVNTWVKIDGILLYYTLSISSAEQDSQEINTIINIFNYVYAADMIFVNSILVFAIVGMLVRKREQSAPTFDIMQWSIIGWVLFLILAESQSRYRYPIMAFMIIFASIGINKILSRKKSINYNRQIQRT